MVPFKVHKIMRGKTIPAKELLKLTKKETEDTEYPAYAIRPETRSDCADGPRPCAWVSCKYNLYLDVSKSGAIKFNFPDVEVENMHDSCVLDVADRGGITLEEVGQIMNLTRERIRQVELHGISKIKEVAPIILGCSYCGQQLAPDKAIPLRDGYICGDCQEEINAQ
jgi:hypothetical protein